MRASCASGSRKAPSWSAPDKSAWRPPTRCAATDWRDHSGAHRARLLREDEAADARSEQLEQHGVELRTGVTVTAIQPDRAPAYRATWWCWRRLSAHVEIAAGAGIESAAPARDPRRPHDQPRAATFAAGRSRRVTHPEPDAPPGFRWAPRRIRPAAWQAPRRGARERFLHRRTSIVSIFGMGSAMTGFRWLRRAPKGFRPGAARHQRPAALLHGPEDDLVELVADRAHGAGRGSVIGEDGAAGRINVIATALQTHMRVDESTVGPGLCLPSLRYGTHPDRRPSKPDERTRGDRSPPRAGCRTKLNLYQLLKRTLSPFLEIHDHPEHSVKPYNRKSPFTLSNRTETRTPRASWR